MTTIERESLEAERDFLLRSIADLDAEREAGDLEPADYEALRDDYVARAAEVIRVLQGASVTAPAKPSGRRGLFVVVACVAVAAVAGIALAGAVGSRSAGAPATGSLPSTTAERLQQASQLIGEGKPIDAIKVYDEILDADPEQPVALAYRGWIVRLAGLKEQGLAYVDRAVAADPAYPDAHFFRGMMLWQDKGDPAGAVGEFRLFLANRPPPAMVGMVEDALRRASQAAGIPVE